MQTLKKKSRINECPIYLKPTIELIFPECGSHGKIGRVFDGRRGENDKKNDEH